MDVSSIFYQAMNGSSMKQTMLYRDKAWMQGLAVYVLLLGRFTRTITTKPRRISRFLRSLMRANGGLRHRSQKAWRRAWQRRLTQIGVVKDGFRDATMGTANPML
jgi:hypothetical protein